MVVGQEVVLLIDRGLLDGKAFVDAGSWQALMDDMQMNEVVVRDRRYDAVLHLVTAAQGAPHAFNTLNNEHRSPDLQEAIERDIRLRAAYMGHKNFTIIDNRSDFTDKMNMVKEQVHNILGYQGSTSFFKKFLLKKVQSNAQQSHSLPINLPLG